MAKMDSIVFSEESLAWLKGSVCPKIPLFVLFLGFGGLSCRSEESDRSANGGKRKKQEQTAFRTKRILAVGAGPGLKSGCNNQYFQLPWKRPEQEPGIIFIQPQLNDPKSVLIGGSLMPSPVGDFPI